MRDQNSMTPDSVATSSHQSPTSPQKGLAWWLFFPARLTVEIFVTLFDMILSRYLIAGALVSIFWLPCYFLFGFSLVTWVWPTVILGACLCGLWDGCHMLEIRPYFSRFVLVPPEPWQVPEYRATPLAAENEFREHKAAMTEETPGNGYGEGFRFQKKGL